MSGKKVLHFSFHRQHGTRAPQKGRRGRGGEGGREVTHPDRLTLTLPDRLKAVGGALSEPVGGLDDDVVEVTEDGGHPEEPVHDGQVVVGEDAVDHTPKVPAHRLLTNSPKYPAYVDIGILYTFVHWPAA